MSDEIEREALADSLRQALSDLAEAQARFDNGWDVTELCHPVERVLEVARAMGLTS